MRTLRLEGSLDIAGVQELQTRLAEVLEAEGPWAIEASDVERVDAAAAQLLHAFVREAQARCLEVAWRAPSPALREALALLGLERTLAAVAEASPAPAGDPSPARDLSEECDHGDDSHGR